LGDVVISIEIAVYVCDSGEIVFNVTMPPIRYEVNRQGPATAFRDTLRPGLCLRRRQARFKCPHSGEASKIPTADRTVRQQLQIAARSSLTAYR
jgi:hypothetical protein